MPVLTRRQTQILQPQYDYMNGCVARWTFGDLSDASGFGHQLTPSATAPTMTNFPVGNKFGASFSSGRFFSASNPSNILAGAGPYSVCGWFRLNGAVATYGSTIISQSPVASNANFDITLGIDADNQKITMNTYNGSVVTSVKTAALSQNRWYWFCAIRNGSSSVIYVDGVSAATGTLNTTVATSDACTIGCMTGKSTTTYFNGPISDLRVYNRVLTLSEVRSIYTSSFQQPTDFPTQYNPPAVTHSAPNADVTVGGWTGG